MSIANMVSFNRVFSVGDLGSDAAHHQSSLIEFSYRPIVFGPAEPTASASAWHVISPIVEIFYDICQVVHQL